MDAFKFCSFHFGNCLFLIRFDQKSILSQSTSIKSSNAKRNDRPAILFGNKTVEIAAPIFFVCVGLVLFKI